MIHLNDNRNAHNDKNVRLDPEPDPEPYPEEHPEPIPEASEYDGEEGAGVQA